MFKPNSWQDHCKLLLNPNQSPAVCLTRLSDSDDKRHRASKGSSIGVPLSALRGIPRLAVSEEEAGLLGHGRPVPYRVAREPADEGAGQESGAEVRCAVAALDLPAGSGDEGGLALIAVVAAAPDGWRPLVVWNTGESGGG